MNADKLRAAASHPVFPTWATLAAGVAILITLWTRSSDLTAKDAEDRGALKTQVHVNTGQIDTQGGLIQAQQVTHSEDMQDLKGEIGKIATTVATEVGKIQATQAIILQAIQRVEGSLPAGE